MSSQMYSTRLMGDACFNNIVDKNISPFCGLLCHVGFHRNNVICLKIAISLTKISRLFNNVHLLHHKVSIVL